MSKRTHLVAAIALAALLGSVAPVAAAELVVLDDGEHGWTATAMFAYHAPAIAGAGLLVGVPVAPHGIGAKLNDALYVEIDLTAGGDFARAGAAIPTTSILGGLLYEVHVYEWLAPYFALRVGLKLRHLPEDRVKASWAGLAGFGLLFPFQDHFAARVELGILETGFPAIRGGLSVLF